MSEQEALAKQNEDVTADNVEEAVTGVTSADPTRVEEEVQQAPEELQEVSEEQQVTSDGDVEAQEIEQEEPVSEEPATEEASVQTEEVQAEEETPVAESNGDISFTDYIDNIPQIKRGATVNGVIVRYDDENVFVDVKDKSEGKISKREFENDPEFDLDKAIEEKTPIEVYVKNIRNTDQGKEILLSKARVDFSKHKAVVEEAFNDKTPITVKVVNVVKDGVIAAYGGVDIYIHRTQLDFNVVEDLEPYKGTEMEIMVTQFDPDRKRLRVSGSRRALLNRERKARADELWDSIAVGDIYEGVVRNITDFGCFVDIGGVDGLVHISELSWNRIKHPSEVVAVGDVIQVYVKDFDKERKRISLGYKRYEDDPYHDIEERFPVGGIVHGKVVRMFNFGAFIEIAPGVDALCHISQISSRRLDKPGDVLKEGMEVDARVLDVNNEERKISISIRDVQPLDDFIGEAAEKEEKRQDTREKKKKERLPNSYSDSNNEERPLSDMEKAFAAAKAAQEGNEDVAEEEVTEEVSDAAEDVQTEVEAVEAETEEAVDSVEEEVEAETEVAVEEVEEVNEEAEETTEKVEKTAEEVEEVKNTEE